MPQPCRSTISGNGPSIAAGGIVTPTSSGTPSQVCTRVASVPAQNCTPDTLTHGTLLPNTLGTVAAPPGAARTRPTIADSQARIRILQEYQSCRRRWATNWGRRGGNAGPETG